MIRLQLDDLVSPLSVASFVDDHWNTGRPSLGTLCHQKLSALQDHALFGSFERMLPRLTDQIILMGSQHFRAAVAPSESPGFLRRGYNLYLTNVQRQIPEIVSVFDSIAPRLGLAPPRVYIEAFAGVAGGVSTRHFDHDINFQVLLRGQKIWKVEQNLSIRNPLKPYHPTRRVDNSLDGFREESFAECSISPDFVVPQEIVAKEGDVVFVPRGYWHEVRSLTDTWSINVVLKGMTWAEALANSLLGRLNRCVDLRAFCDEVSNETVDRFQRHKEHAVRELLNVGLSEALFSGDRSTYRWSHLAEDRKLFSDAGITQLSAPQILEDPLEIDDSLRNPVSQLVLFRGDFSWTDAQGVNPNFDVVGLRCLLEDLVGLGLLEVLS